MRPGPGFLSSRKIQCSSCLLGFAGGGGSGLRFSMRLLIDRNGPPCHCCRHRYLASGRLILDLYAHHNTSTRSCSLISGHRRGCTLDKLHAHSHDGVLEVLHQRQGPVSRTWNIQYQRLNLEHRETLPALAACLCGHVVGKAFGTSLGCRPSEAGAGLGRYQMVPLVCT